MQYSWVLKKNAFFLQKHDKHFFGKDFIDNFAETIKAKKKTTLSKEPLAPKQGHI